LRPNEDLHGRQPSRRHAVATAQETISSGRGRRRSTRGADRPPCLETLGLRQRPLPFVRRGVYCCSAVTRLVAFPPPSLGVSSLDLGRLHPQAAPFFALFSVVPSAGLDYPPFPRWSSVMRRSRCSHAQQ